MRAAPISCMTLLGFIVLLVIGAICGALAQLIVGYGSGGFLVSAGLGIVGSFVGTWLAGVLHLPEVFIVRVERVSVPIVWSIVGAAILLAIAALFRRRRTIYRDSYV